ncbi:MAG: DNA mismatch repair protein MutL [Chthonomonas sp.]
MSIASTAFTEAPIGPRVRLLDPRTVNQIAAGEVVERPASVVKELVENSLDAGAKHIEIALEGCGKRLVRIADDGAGMSPEDARMALERHATSKLRTVDDLGGVATLGFRGEAIPSIASVSRFRLATSDGSGARCVIRVEGGRLEEAGPEFEPGPQGTEVVVEDLFFNTPARLKFLKSDATELSACLDAVVKAALARPDVAFQVRHNGKLALRTSGSGDLLEAIVDAWGRDIARPLLPVDTVAAGIRVVGFAGQPHATRPTRAYQLVFVNGRPVRTRTILAALDQAFREFTPERRYPTVVLDLRLDPSRVDVNVSPTKSEVRFEHEGAAFDAVRHAVRAALHTHGLVPGAEGAAMAGQALRLAETPNLLDQPAADDAFARLLGFGGGFGAPKTEGDGPRDGHGSPFGPLAGGSWVGGPLLGGAFGHGASRSELAFQAQMPLGAHAGLPETEALSEGKCPFDFLLRNMRVVGQLFNTFILVETARGLAIVDQHVAHERILYEYLCGMRGKAAIETQELLEPQTLHVDRRAAALLEERLDEIRAVGYAIEPFGAESFLVRSVPAAVKRGAAIKVLQDLADELVDGVVSQRLQPTREKIWITTSCKMAVKAGDPLGMAEMERLIVELATTENPYTCPHGRPITVLVSPDELMRRFKR